MHLRGAQEQGFWASVSCLSADSRCPVGQPSACSTSALPVRTKTRGTLCGTLVSAEPVAPEPADSFRAPSSGQNLAVNRAVALRKADSGVKGRFSGTIPFGWCKRLDFAVYKNKICLSPLSLGSMREAAVRTAAESRAAESELPSRCAGMNKPARLRVTSLLNDH